MNDSVLIDFALEVERVVGKAIAEKLVALLIGAFDLFGIDVREFARLKAEVPLPIAEEADV